MVDLEQGTVESSHPAGTPDFDDVIIRTSEGTVLPTGTRYRVERNADGTDVAVSEGSVHLKGEAIYRVAGPGQDVGKQAPATDMDLRAGDRARLIKRLETRIIDDRLIDRKLDPWDDGHVQALMDEWLRTAIPPSRDPQVIMHYNEWAQPLSQAARATNAPDHPADWTRYRYLWETRGKWTSTKLCTLGEFVDRRLANKPLTDCALPAFATQTTPNNSGTLSVNLARGSKAIDIARNELAQTEGAEKARAEKAESDRREAERIKKEQTERQRQQQQADNIAAFVDLDTLLGLPPQAEARAKAEGQQQGNYPKSNPPSAGAPGAGNPQPAVSRFVGEWTCVGRLQGKRYDPFERDVVSADGKEYMSNVVIKSGNGAFTLRVENDLEQPANIIGATLRASFSAMTSGGVLFDAEWVLGLQDTVLTGTHHHRDAHGSDYTQTLRCTRAASKK
jgi:FecR protein